MSLRAGPGADRVHVDQPPIYPHVVVDGWSLDQNTFTMIGDVRIAMKEAGVPLKERDKFSEEALQHSSRHATSTVYRYVTVTH